MWTLVKGFLGKWKVWLVIAAVSFAAGMGGGWYLTSKYWNAKQVGALKNEIESQNEKITEMQSRLAIREAARVRAVNNAAEWRSKYESDKLKPDVAEFIAIPTPPLVYDRLCELDITCQGDRPETDPLTDTHSPTDLRPVNSRGNNRVLGSL